LTRLESFTGRNTLAHFVTKSLFLTKKKAS
jgi:hypothetical protein